MFVNLFAIDFVLEKQKQKRKQYKSSMINLLTTILSTTPTSDLDFAVQQQQKNVHLLSSCPHHRRRLANMVFPRLSPTKPPPITTMEEQQQHPHQKQPSPKRRRRKYNSRKRYSHFRQLPFHSTMQHVLRVLLPHSYDFTHGIFGGCFEGDSNVERCGNAEDQFCWRRTVFVSEDFGKNGGFL